MYVPLANVHFSISQHCSDVAIAWSGQLLYDFVIFLLTLVRSLWIRTKGRSITYLLLRDGELVVLTFPLWFTPMND